MQIKPCFRGDLCLPLPSRPPSPSRSHLRASALSGPAPAPQDQTQSHELNSHTPTLTHPMSLSSQMDLVFVVLIRLSLPWGPKGQSPAASAGKAGHIIPVIKNLVI